MSNIMSCRGCNPAVQVTSISTAITTVDAELATVQSDLLSKAEEGDNNDIDVADDPDDLKDSKSFGVVFR